MAERRDSNDPPFAIKSLSTRDGQVLDQLLAVRSGQLHINTLSGDAAERAEKLGQLLSVLDALPEEESSTRAVQQTMAAVQAARQRERFAAQVQMLAEPRPTLDLGWRQIAAAAAVFVVGVSLLVPVLERNQAEGQRIACMSNMRTAGAAIGQYAADHDGVLPRGPVQPGATWWNVGQVNGEDEIVSSNSAHLYILVRKQHIEPRDLACPSNTEALAEKLTPDHYDWPRPEAVSYSYQNQYTEQPTHVSNNPHMAILADKNPLFITQNNRMTFCSTTPRGAPSRIHESRGQNVLRADGRAQWETTPFIRQPGRPDATNIWVADGVDAFTGTETPSRPDDSFLVP